jgi:tRNA threonylcarbamoyladenosine biosynthesis protein TsaE
MPLVRSGSDGAKLSRSELDEQPDPDKELLSSSPDDTFEIGRSIAEGLNGPAVIMLSGELGAGKTVLAKGVAAGLDIDPVDVTSPSFTLINVHEGRLRLYHIDFYRLESGATAGLGLEEIFDDPRAVIMIEWPERLLEVPKGAIRVRIEHLAESSRKITVSPDLARSSQD